LTTPSECTLALVALPDCVTSGCHTPKQAELEQMNFPPPSPLRLYRVMPLEFTRIVPPTLEFDAVFTAALDPSLGAGAEAGWLAVVELLVLFELLPQPASRIAAAATGVRNFAVVRTMWLLCREPRRLCGRSHLKMPRAAFPSRRLGAASRYDRAVSIDESTEVQISRPRAEVAAFASDPDNATAWYANIKAVRWETPRPVRVGTRFAFIARFMGRRLAYVYEVKQLVAGERLVMATSEGPFAMETTYTWADAEGGATGMRLRNRGEPNGFPRLIAPLMGSAVRRANRKDLRRLKLLLEADHHTRAAV
jgi:hypothetical protein